MRHEDLKLITFLWGFFLDKVPVLMVDATFYLSMVDKKSTKNFCEFSGLRFSVSPK